jgi:hypothetical protein
MSKSERLNCVNPSKRALTLCLALAGAALATFAPSAKADSYLDLMLNDATPDYVLAPYAIDSTATGYHIYGPFGGMTMFTNNAAGGTAIPILFDMTINTSTATGTLVEDAVSPALPGIDSTTLLDFGSVSGHPGVSYYFTFSVDGGIALPPGTVVGGLLTVDPTTGAPVDIKQYTFAVPTPAAAQGGALLMGAVAAAGIYRRSRSRQASVLA